MISIGLIIITIIIFLKVNKLYQFTILSFSALLPFSYGDFRSVPDLLFIEWITLVTFLLILNDLSPAYSLEKKIRRLSFKGLGIFIFAIGVLIVWSIISFIGNEIFSKDLLYTPYETGSKRTYFTIYNNILLYFTISIFTAFYYDKINIEKFFKILMYSSVLLGFIRLSSFFTGLEIPFLSTIFGYGGEFSKGAQQQYGGTAYRLGGLTDLALIGLPSLFSLFIINRKMNIPVFIIFFMFIFLSGGRTFMVGTIFAIVCFSVLFYPKNLIYITIAGCLFLLIISISVPETVLKGQVGRLTKFSDGKIVGEDSWRGFAWKLYLQNFSENPIFGKGIGRYDDNIYSAKNETKQFVKKQLFSGGHGSYISLLSTFGIGGLLYFIIMLFGGINLAYKKIKEYRHLDTYKSAIAVFVFMLLIIKMIDFVTGGNGLNVSVLFYSVGLISSLVIISNQRSSNLNIITDLQL